MTLSNQDIQQLGNLPDAEKRKLPLAPGDDTEDSPWRNLYNLRLQVDGQYVYWTTRGGSTLVNSFFGNVLTVYPFQPRVGGVAKEYLAVHTAAGHVYLWDIAGQSSNQIASGLFSTTEQIQFTNVGRFLYIFDYDGGEARYYDLTSDTLSEYLSYDSSYIHDVSFIQESFFEQNILGLEVGSEIIVFPNYDGAPKYQSYKAEILTMNVTNTGVQVTYQDPDETEHIGFFGGASTNELEDADLIFPYSDDTKDLVGKPASKESDGSGGTQTNDSYSRPFIYRQYVFVDMLNDGSITVNGKPYQVAIGAKELLQTGATEISLSTTAAGNNVVKRFLCTTRWHASARAAFSPSTEAYPNSPLYIVKEVRPGKVSVTNATPDDQLFRQITELYPTTAGVPDLFGSAELSPNSVAAFKGSLMLAGYTVNRPLPKPYTDPTNATDENVFVNIQSTTQLPNNMALAFQFEYTDGKKSNIVETEHFLQEGSTVETEPVACNQVKASASHQVTGGAQRDGDLEVIYDGITIVVPLTLASHASANDVASAIQQAVDGDADIRCDAALLASDTVEYTEKRFGEGFNGQTVDVNNLPIAAVGYIDVDANALPAPSPATAHFDVDANNLGGGASEDHTLTIDGNATSAITINDTDTLQDIVDKYVTEINGDATISADWTASKVDNGDGTWRCLITSDANDETWNARAISISGDTDVTVVVSSPTSGGNDGQETHTITVGANTTGNITVSNGDTLQAIAQAYVDKINNDGTISSGWTASLVDDGDGTWRCKITSDNPGSSDNSTTISVNASDTVAGGTQVTFSTTNTSGGHDNGAGITFDTEDPSMAGAQEPEGNSAKAFIDVVQNGLIVNKSVDYKVEIEKPSGGYAESNFFTVNSDDTAGQIVAKMKTALDNSASITADWLIADKTRTETQDNPKPGEPDYSETIEYIELASKIKTDAWNGLDFGVVAESSYNATEDGFVSYDYSSPGTNEDITAGGGGGCTQAIGSITVTADNLSSGTEDHTLTIDGNATSAITVASSDSIEQIIDKYIAEARATTAIDLDWKAEKVDNGDGSWTMRLYYRNYGTVGNSKTISVSGNTEISITTSNSSGGTESSELPTSPASTVNSNRVQIHSLNMLVSKVYVLGRTNDGSKQFHILREVGISDPEAHGMTINLPNTESALNEVESEVYAQPSSDEVLETVELTNYLNVGTPYQQLQISTQEEIVDQSDVRRAVAVDFATDTTVMRYRVMIFTDRNIQMGYLVDQTQQLSDGRTRRTFDGDFEIVFSGMKASSREGISDVLGQIIWPTAKGVYAWPRQGRPQQLFDVRRYGVSANNNLKDVIYNQDHDEFWFVYGDSEIVAYDIDSQTTRRMEYTGIGSIRAGAFFGDKLYIGSATDVLETDVASTTTDTSGGDTVTAEAESRHLGNEITQTRLMECVIGGQNFNCQLEVDLQDERFEDVATGWSDQFSADKTISAKTLSMAGASFQIQRMSIMPRLRLSFDAVNGGRLSHIILKSQVTENKGKARQ